MEIRIEPYTGAAGEFEILASMIEALYEEDPTEDLVDRTKIRRTVEEAAAKPDKLAIYLFRDGATVVGYGILTFFWSNEHGADIVNIDEIFVLREARGRGAATAFIERLSDLYPLAAGLKLEASPSNEKAIRFYRSLGFTEAPNLHMLRRRGD